MNIINICDISRSSFKSYKQKFIDKNLDVMICLFLFIQVNVSIQCEETGVVNFNFIINNRCYQSVYWLVIY